MSDFKWTKIDPAVHTQHWFIGKSVAFISGDGIWSRRNFQGTANTMSEATHFFLFPPLPDPLEEEIEREAREHTSREQLWDGIPGYEEAIKAFIAGARAFLGRGK